MRKRLTAKTIAAFFLAFAILSAGFLWYRGPNLAVAGAVLVCLFSSIFLYLKQQPANLILLLVSSFVTYCIAELVFFAFLHSRFENFNLSQHTYYSANSMSVDTLVGYRFRPDASIRTLRYIHGVKVFDNTFHTNNYGYVSPSPFIDKKAKDVVRIVVLGDSFSEGIFLEKNYPTRLHEMFARYGKKVEIYNFSLHGGGIANWYRIFFKEIIKMEFDQLIIASYPDDIDRDLAVFHTFPDGVYFDRIPVAANSVLTVSELKRAIQELPESKVADLIDENATYKNREVPFGPYIYRYLNKRFQVFFEKRAEPKKGIPAEQATLAAFEQKHGAEKIRQFAAITDTCFKMHKPVLIMTIPDLMMLKDLHATSFASKNDHQIETETLARILHCSYFDGYSVFRDMPFKDILDSAWLKFDGHWGQRGSDMFANKLYEFLNTSDSTLSGL